MTNDQQPENKFTKRRTNKPLNGSIAFEHGKLSPQAIDLEEAVLGAMMLEKRKLIEIIELLKPEIFYKEEHGRIFKAIQILFGQNKNIDILTVTEQLRSSGELDMVGGPYYVACLTNRVVSSANIDFHVRILLQKFTSRELIRISSDVIHDSYEDTTDVFDLQDSVEKQLFQLRSGTVKKNYDHISVPLAEYIKSMQSGIDNKGRLLGIPSGYLDLDRISGGWQKSDLIILASRPSMGKTACALNFARNAVIDFTKKVGFFSLEMSKSQLTQRLVSIETMIPISKLKNLDLSNYDFEKIYQATDKINNSGFYIDDTAALSIFEFQAKSRRMVANHGVELIIVDYLQLMKGSKERIIKGNREQEISEISQTLKATAKELDVPVIALSQLSRACEARSDKRPMLSDLRESGSIEQDADMVIFPYRQGYYDKNDEPEMEVDIAKYRNGSTKMIKLNFYKDFTKVKDQEPEFETMKSNQF